MIVDGRFISNVNKVPGIRPAAGSQRTIKTQGDFNSILQEQINNSSAVKFSKHAELRLQARNISLSGEQKEKLNGAVKKAEQKGVQDSLVLVDNIAFVVNVKSKTVITALNSNELKENVFTNIDGAVFT